MRTEDIGTIYSPWQPETDPVRNAIYSKVQEELNELGIEVSRCQSQGIEETNPTTAVMNIFGLADELDDVEVMIQIIRDKFKIPRNMERQEKKRVMQDRWHQDLQKA